MRLSKIYEDLSTPTIFNVVDVNYEKLDDHLYIALDTDKGEMSVNVDTEELIGVYYPEAPAKVTDEWWDRFFEEIDTTDKHFLESLYKVLEKHKDLKGAKGVPNKSKFVGMVKAANSRVEGGVLFDFAEPKDFERAKKVFIGMNIEFEENDENGELFLPYTEASEAEKIQKTFKSKGIESEWSEN